MSGFEIIGTVAAAGQFVEQGSKVVALIKNIHKRFQNTPHEIEHHRQELGSFTEMISEIKRVDSEGLRNPGTEVVLKRCAAHIAALEEIFEYVNFKEDDSLGRKTWKAVSGMKREDDMKDLFHKLEKEKSALLANGVIDVKKYLNLHEKQLSSIEYKLPALSITPASGSEEQKCLQALVLTDPVDDRAGLETAKESTVPGTCEWITEVNEYKAWLASESGLLWISGGPGKGKTMLSIYLSHKLEHNATSSERILVILDKYKKYRDSLFEQRSFEPLWAIFLETITRPELVGVCGVIDDLDECEIESIRPLLTKLQQLANSHTSQLANKEEPIVISREKPHIIAIQLDSILHI